MQLREILRYTVLGGIFALPLIAFFVAESMFFPYITGKNFAFRILIELMLGAWAVLALIDAQYRPKFSWILVALFSFLAIIGIADLQGTNLFRSFWSNFERMEGYVTLLHLVAYFLVAGAVLNTEKLWKIFLSYAVGLSAIMGIMSVAEVLEAFKAGETVRADVTLGNPIYLAVYALFHIFITLWLMYKWQGARWGYTLYGAALFLQLFMLYYSATRGAQLGFLGGIVLTTLLIVGAGVFGKVREKNWTAHVAKPVLLTAAGIFAGVVILVSGFFLVKDAQFVQESPVLSRLANISITGGTVASRLTIWQMALEGVKERPILGYGQGNFGYVFSKHYNAAEMYNQEPWFDRTHNIVFDWLIAGGIVGFLSYVSIFLAALYYLWFSRGGRENFDVTERALWTGLLAAYTAHNLAVFDNIISYILFFTVLAFIHERATSTASPIRYLARFTGRFAGRVVPLKTAQTMVLPIVLVLTLGLMYMTNYAGVASAQTLLDALVPQPAGLEKTLELYRKALSYDHTVGRQEVVEQLTQRAISVAGSEEASDELKNDFVTLAREATDKEIGLNPNDARLRLFAAGFYNRIGDREQALAHALKAYELSPTKQHILFQLGEVYLNTGELDKALEIFRQAFESAPEYDEARKLYAFAANYAGNFELADRLLMEEYGTIALNEERFIRAYDQAGRYDVLEQIFTKRIEENPADTQARVSLAATYVELGNTARAIAVLEEAIEINPEFKEQGEKFIEDIRSGNTP